MTAPDGGEIKIGLVPDGDKFAVKADAIVQEEEKKLGPAKVPIEADVDEASFERANAEVDALVDEEKTITINVDESSTASVRRALGQVDDALNKLRETPIELPFREDQLLGLREQLDELQQRAEHIPIRFDIDSVEGKNKAIDQLQRELDKLTPPTLTVELDADKLRAQLDQLTAERDAQVEITSNLERMHEAAIQFNKDLDAQRDDAEKINAEYDRISGSIDKIVEQNKQIRLDRQFDEAIRINKALEDQHAEALRLNQDYDRIATSIEAIVERSRRARGVKFDVTVDEDRSKAAIARSMARLADFAGIELEKGTRNVGRGFDRLIDGARNLGRSLEDAAAGGARGLVKALEGVSKVTFALIPGLDGLSAALGPAGLVLAGTILVGVISALAVALGSALLVVEGLVQGALASLPILAGGFATLAAAAGIAYIAFKNMPAPVQDAANKLRDLKKVIADKFWATASQPFIDMVSNLVPTLDKVAGDVSTAVGGLFGRIFTAAGESPQFKAALDHIGTALTNALDSISADPIVDSFSNLGDAIATSIEIATPFLDKLNEKIADGLKWLAEWLSNKDNQDKLSDWFDKGLAAATTLWRVVVDTKEIIVAILSAIKGSKVDVDDIAKGFDALAAFFKDPGVQQGMTIFWNLMKFLAGVSLDQLAADLAQLNYQLWLDKTIIDGIQAGWQGFYNWLHDTFVPWWKGLWGRDGDISGPFYDFADDLKKFFGTDLITIVIDGVSSMVLSFGVGTGQMRLNWSSFTSFLETVWTVALGSIGINWDVAQAAIVAGWNILRTNWNNLVSNMMSIWSSMASTIVRVMVQALITIATEGISGFIVRVISALASLPGRFADVGSQAVQGFIRGLGSNPGGIISAAVNMAVTAINAARHALDINSPSRVFMKLGEGTIDGYIMGLESRYAAVKKSLSGLSADISASPLLPSMSVLGASVDAAGSSRTFNYYAAPGSSLSSEEELFAAVSRPRFGW